jgi:hypothetical protein
MSRIQYVSGYLPPDVEHLLVCLLQSDEKADSCNLEIKKFVKSFQNKIVYLSIGKKIIVF